MTSQTKTGQIIHLIVTEIYN